MNSHKTMSGYKGDRDWATGSERERESLIVAEELMVISGSHEQVINAGLSVALRPLESFGGRQGMPEIDSVQKRLPTTRG